MKPALAALLALAASAPALAGPTVIDFESVDSFNAVGTQYAARNVVFTGNALALGNDALGPYFSNAPSPQRVMFVADDPAVANEVAVMNVGGGFEAFSFFFSAAERLAGGVKVWSGLDGTGSLLASFDLDANAAGCAIDSPLCTFATLGGSLAAMAFSVTFAEGNVVFDNVSVVPTPPSLALVGLALGALALRRRRS